MMDDKRPFPSTEAEVGRLLDELTSTKQVLREISDRVGRMEKRVKRAFPAVSAQRDRVRKEAENRRTNQPPFSAEQAYRLFDEIVLSMKADQADLALKKLDGISSDNLELVAKELGISVGTKPNRGKLERMIAGRARESVMLTRHIARTDS
jgi:hypothetical protein